MYAATTNNEQSLTEVCTLNSVLYIHDCVPVLMLVLIIIFIFMCRLLKKKLFKQELEPNWPGPEKVRHTVYLKVFEN